MGVCSAKESKEDVKQEQIPVFKWECQKFKTLYFISVKNLLQVFPKSCISMSRTRQILKSILVKRVNFQMWFRAGLNLICDDGSRCEIYPYEQHIESNQYLSYYIFNESYKKDRTRYCFLYFDKPNIDTVISLFRIMKIDYSIYDLTIKPEDINGSLLCETKGD